MARSISSCLLFSALWGICCAKAHAEDNRPDSPIDARAAITQMQHHPDVRVELVASEPQVVDPVAMAFDERGRLWVVEMRDYPNGPAKGKPGKSRIRVLTDTNNDGFYETAVTFADELLFATGLQPWNGGVIVTLSGSVMWMKDNDGDNQADTKEIWFNGFSAANPQLRANHPTLATDGWVYVANGLRGGKVIASRPGWNVNAPVVDISGRDFRFHPLTGKYEAISGVGQFGLTFDDQGNRFVCSNRNPLKHIVLEDRYLKQNPDLAVRTVFHDVSAAAEKSRVFAINRPWTTSTLHAGQFTAACGVTVYRGDALGDEFYGNSFTCEPTGSLIHRDVLTPAGVTFKSKPGRDGIEFLASKDDWFRAVNLSHGPDGALYVCDMYRAVIEHPQFMPTELKTRPDLELGNDKGRIYRIVAAKADAAELQKRRQIDFTSKTTAELAAMPIDANAWTRNTIARLVLQKQDQSVVPALKQAAIDFAQPQKQIRALQMLDGLQSLDAELLRGILSQAAANHEAGETAWPGVVHAARLAEQFVSGSPDLVNVLTNFYLPQTPADFFAVAQALSNAPAIPPAWADMMCRVGTGDKWFRTMLLAIHPESAVTMLEAKTPKDLKATIQQAAELIGRRGQNKEINRALLLISSGGCGPENSTSLVRLEYQLLALNSLANGMRVKVPLQKYIDAHPAAAGCTALLKMAGQASLNAKYPADLRVACCRLLTHAPQEIATPPLVSLATLEQDRSLKRTAIECLASHKPVDIGDLLLPHLKTESPVIQRAILAAMLTTPKRMRRLLQAVEDKEIPITQLDVTTTKRLRANRAPNVGGWARRLLANAVPRDRRDVLTMYQPALKQAAKPENGAVVFKKNCATCHQIGDVGVNVAPDIADSRSKTPEFLLTNILDPNRAVDANYFGYTVVTRDGQVHTGIIASETASSITLKQPENKTLQILRSDIDSMRSTGLSLMPVGLEKNISVQEMADLISYIKNWRYMDGQVPLTTGERGAAD